MHAVLGLAGAFVATGAVFDPAIVPLQYQHHVLLGIMAIFYLAGVKMPQPGSADESQTKIGQQTAEWEKAKQDSAPK
jgi:hypothetical protein